MYQVIDCKRGNAVDSEFDNFDDALARAEELAEDQADGEVEVSAYENGSRNEDGSGEWEAGACPDGDSGGYWPHVEFVQY